MQILYALMKSIEFDLIFNQGDFERAHAYRNSTTDNGPFVTTHKL